MSTPQHTKGSGLFIIRPSVRSYLRSFRGAAGVAFSFLALGLLDRLARVASDGTSGPAIAATIVALGAALFLAIMSLAFLRGRVMTQPGQLAVVGLFTTKQVPSDKIERVLLRTISYSGNSVREVLVVGDRGQILCRVAASFYADDDLRALFSGLGFPPQGSWSNVIALGPIEGLSAEESIASKLRSDDSS